MPPDSDMHYESATFPLSDEELFDYTRNSWLVEFSDPSTRRAESESAKTFLSRQPVCLPPQVRPHEYQAPLQLWDGGNGQP